MRKKYDIKPNNYKGTIFISLVIIASAYILINVLKNPGVEINLDTNPKEINTGTEINQNDLIKDLQNYLNPGDTSTNIIYQSMYNSNSEVTANSINEESMLYIAYQYIKENKNIEENSSYLTCETQQQLGLNLINCSDLNNIEYEYKINTSVTKEQLSDTILKIFNRTITQYQNFYTSKDSACYYINNEYYCISKINQETNNDIVRVFFVEAYSSSSNNEIQIIESYKFISNGNNYSGFLSDEVGEAKYISKFEKINDEYHWISTKRYIEN